MVNLHWFRVYRKEAKPNCSVSTPLHFWNCGNISLFNCLPHAITVSVDFTYDLNFIRGICKIAESDCELRLGRLHGTAQLPLDGFLWNWYLRFQNLSSSLIKIWHITGPLHEDPCTFMVISRWILYRMRCFRNKIVGKIKTHIYLISFFFPKIILCMR
jgi:hypothetical protein